MVINSNMMATNTYNAYNSSESALSSSMEKLSSGYRINSAADDAAGLSISEKMRSQIRGLDQASDNAEDGISMLQTAEGSMSETEDILQRMRELAVQAANDTNVTTDREAISDEISQLQDEIDQIATTTTFNTKNLLDGSLSTNAVKLQIGADSGVYMSFTIGNVSTSALGVAGSSISVSTYSSASAAITTIDAAIENISAQRSKLGAYENRLDYTIDNLSNASENIESAESNIRDVDMASEMMEYTQQSILQQASQSMLTQAMQLPQNVLSLLQ